VLSGLVNFLISLPVLFLLAWTGAQWAIRAQYVILAVLGLSIAVFMLGLGSHFSAARFAANLKPMEGYDFWRVFAIYFPAVTGILAGVSMSGDLKDPGRAIPRGTLAAIGVSFAVYAGQMALAGGAADQATLAREPFELLLRNAFLGMSFLVTAGVFAATLSSAIGSYLGAPRVLQALARDGIFGPLRFFAAGAKGTDEPRRAMLLTLVITLAVLLAAGSGKGGGALDAVASMVTMFFLYTYGMTNLAAFVESFGANPSFRPRFRYFHWVTGLIGAAGCGATAFLISPLAAVVAAAAVAAVFHYVRGRVLRTAFGDARRGFLYTRLRANLLKLRDLPLHAKNWRPTALVLSGNPKTRPELVRCADWMEGGRGILSLAEILVGEFEDLRKLREGELARLRKFIREQDVAAFPVVVAARDLDEGIRSLLQAVSLDPLRPNMVVFGWTASPDRRQAFERNLRTAYGLGMSVIVLHPGRLAAIPARPRIDIWWRGQKNGFLMLILAHLMGQHWEWDGARVRILRVVPGEAGRQPAREALEALAESARIKADVEVLVSQGRFEESLRAHSADADLIMLGFNIMPDAGAPVFAAGLEEMLAGMPPALLVCSTGEASALE